RFSRDWSSDVCSSDLAHGNFLVDALSVFCFDDAELLNAKDLATAHDCTCVVQLVNVLHGHGKVVRSPGQHGFKAGNAFGREKSRSEERRVGKECGEEA